MKDIYVRNQISSFSLADKDYMPSNTTFAVCLTLQEVATLHNILKIVSGSLRNVQETLQQNRLKSILSQCCGDKILRFLLHCNIIIFL